MSINPLTFGSPVYSPPFSVSPGDTDVMKLRSMETAPLSHESLDENFTNLANKINEILGLNIDEVNITSDGIISPANLGISAGSGLLLSASGVFTHQNRPAPPAGYSTGDLSGSNRRFINAIDFDSFGHVTGFTSGTLNFIGSGSVSVDQYDLNQVTISSSAYTSGSSPSFTDIYATGKVGIGTTNPIARLHIPQPSTTIGGNDVTKGGLLVGTTSAGVAIDDNEIIQTGHQGLNIGTYAQQGQDESYIRFRPLGVEAMRINTDGKVGIGTHDPDVLLTVKGATLGTSVNDETSLAEIRGSRHKLLFNEVRHEGASAGVNWDGVTYKLQKKVDSTEMQSINFVHDSGAGAVDNHIDLYVGGHSSTDPIFSTRFAGNGNVGIGTTNPKAELSVNGLVESSGQIRATGWFTGNTDDHGPACEMGVSSGAAYIMGYDRAGGGYIPLNIGSSNTERITFPASGDSGIIVDGDTTFKDSVTITHTGSWDNPSIHLRGDYPTIKFNDTNTNEDDWYIHVNSSNFYILADRDASGGDEPIDTANNVWESPYGFQLNSNTNKAYAFGWEILTSGYTGHLQGSSLDVRPSSSTTASSRISVDAYRQETVGGVTTGILQEWELYNNGNNSFFGLYDRTGGKYVWTAKTNGNVGIGTTTPNEKLTIYDTVKPVIRLDGSGSNAANTNFGEIQFYNRDASADGPNVAASIHAQSTSSTGSGGSLVFSTENSVANGEGRSADPRMVIDQEGNVGIRTTEPQKTLDVKGTFAISNSKTSYWDFDRDDSNGALKISDTGTEHVRIDTEGNVGIGTDSPEGKLEIYDTTGGWSDPHLHLKGNNPVIKFNDLDANSDDFYLYTNSNNFYVLVDRGASGEDTPADDAGNVWESPNPLQLEGDTNKGYLFGSQIVTKDFTGDLNVSGTLSTDTLSIKSGAIYMWHRSYSVSNTDFQVLKMEDGSDLATGGVYRVTAHIPATGTHTGATAVYWNSDGKWYCNQTTGAGNNSNHIGFIVLSDGSPAIRTWHSTGYSVSVYHERMYLSENDTENTSHLFGLDGIISKPPGDDNLYYNRYTSETGLAGGSEGQKILKSSHVYNGWDVFLHENSGMLMSYTVPQAANHWFGGNVTYDSAGFKARYDGQVVWGKYDSNAATSTVHTLYAARATADNQAVSTTDNQVFSLTCDFNSTRKRVSAYAGIELLLNEQDVETSHTKHGDWISTYSSSHTRDVFYNRVYRQTELKAQVSGDSTSGAAHKAVRVPPGCRKFKVSVLAHGSNNRSNGFYIGVAELDSELPIGKLAVCHNSQYGDSTVVEDTRYQWLRSNGSITTSRQLYTYEFEVADTCKWFSVFILNWTSMSTDTLYFDPDIKIEPIHSEFGQSQGLAYSDFSVRNSSGGYTSGLTWVGEDNSYANYTWHRQGGHVHVDIQIHRKVSVGISNVGAVYFNGLPFPAYEPSYSGGYNNTTYSNGGSHGMGVRTFGHDFVHFNTGTLDGAGVLTMECPSGDLTNGSTTGTIRGSVDYMTEEY